MKILWSVQDLNNALGVKIGFELKVTGLVQFNSKDIQPGDLFVALPGNKDGHEFIKDALIRGAGAIIANRDVNLSLNILEHNKCILVKDTFLALKQLANYRRNQLRNKTKFIAITGSIGKTSTKRAIWKAFTSCFTSFESRKNFNNLLGLLLNMASIPYDTEYAILELGMNKTGELKELSLQLSPDIAIITNVNPVHTEFFDSIESIAEAKCEILYGMNNDGILILNADSLLYEEQYSIARSFGIQKIYKFGTRDGIDSRLKSYQYDLTHQQSNIVVNCHNHDFYITTKSWGRAHAINLAATLLVCIICNLDLNIVINKISELTNDIGRGKLYHLNYNQKPLTLIDDCYNASPAAVKSALSSCADIIQPGRKIVVLGDMNELGTRSQEYHLDLLNDILKNKIDKIVTIGSKMKYLYDSLPLDCKLSHYNNVYEFLVDIDLFTKLLNNKDIILVKGSNNMHLNKVVQYFLNNNEE